ncbi:MAG: ABC transporter permease [Bdellovibrio sp.]
MFYLSIRQLMSRKRQTFLIGMGITLGTVVYITIAGVQLGFREYMVKNLLENQPHMQIDANERDITLEDVTAAMFHESEHVLWRIPPSGKREDNFILYPYYWIERLTHDSRVLGVSRQFSISAIAVRGGIQRTFNLHGIDPEQHVRINTIQDYMVEGDFLALKGGGNRIVAGLGLLERLGAKVGENLMISIGKGEPVPFKIVGSFDTGSDFDRRRAFSNIQSVQQLNLTPGRIGEIAVGLVDPEQAVEMALEYSSGAVDRVQSWVDLNKSFLDMFIIQDVIRNFIIGSILVVSGVGIYNILTIMISQKRKEIAILRSVGYNSREIVELFVIQGMILGIVGPVLGLIIGFAVCQYLGSIKLNIRGMGAHGQGLMISYHYSIYLQAFLLAFFSALIASYLPARAAGKLTPIDIIRTEES